MNKTSSRTIWKKTRTQRPPPKSTSPLGTAGHIDHGKTALVKMLTGCDTDRLKAEKERGITIDLGFAPCKIADLEVGIVDVPGHENFIKTMVAGAAGMDAVLLVVAADDGVMPQTREHMEILTLLGVRHGVVAVTKIDRVDEEHRALVLDDTAAFLRGTFLEGAPVRPVSSVTGEGFDGLFTSLCELLESLEPRPLDGVFRLPVDRAFSAHGYGTIVAGIPVAGSASIDDDLLLLPEGATSKIRQIEVYGRAADTVKAGQCAAINVRQWDARNIRRGHVVTVPGYFTPAEWFIGDLSLLGHEKLTLKSGSEIRLHTGTSEVSAKVYPLEGNRVEAGQQSLVQFHAKKPLVAGPGDHFVIRSLSPVRTIGGGLLIGDVPQKLKRNREGLVEDLRRRSEAVRDPAAFVEYQLETAEAGAAGVDELAVKTKLRPARVRAVLEALAAEKKAHAISPGSHIHRNTLSRLCERVSEIVNAFHAEHPESPGMLLEGLRQACEIDPAVLDGLLGRMIDAGRLTRRDDRFAAAGHSPTFQGEDAAEVEKIERLFRDAGFKPPGIEEVAKTLRADRRKVDKLVKILREHKRLVRVEGGILFHADAVAKAREILVDHFRNEERLESVKFKYLLDTTRKFAIPLLDYFDSIHVTRRVGNTRYLKERGHH